MVVGVLVNHFWDAVAQNCHERREVAWIMPKAAICMKENALENALSILSENHILSERYIFFFAPLYCQFPLK